MLRVTDLDVYYGDAQALWDISLTVTDAEVVSIVGSNGSGKSTLVNTIMGMLVPRRGRIILDDVDITDMPGHRMCRAGVAIVPEGRRLFPAMTVRDNLDLGAFNPAARARHAESLEWVHTLFPRLAERRAQVAGSLSGGEQQMLALGRALMAQPWLLLMDEPSLGLAPVVVDEVFDAIETVNGEGVSIVLVEQNVQRALDISSRAYLLAEGRIVLEGDAKEMAQNPEVRRAVLGV
ncbi:MAG TPA: ABC transporter ATP-binding protein [Acidimicrobiia bacterium]|nr:ABC transporter ATP-binding protein [Acidimicrobiia bacterium]